LNVYKPRPTQKGRPEVNKMKNNKPPKRPAEPGHKNGDWRPQIASQKQLHSPRTPTPPTPQKGRQSKHHRPNGTNFQYAVEFSKNKHAPPQTFRPASGQPDQRYTPCKPMSNRLPARTTLIRTHLQFKKSQPQYHRSTLQQLRIPEYHL